MEKLLILDLDGTIADTRADLALAVNLVRQSFGLMEFSEDKITSYVGNGRKQLMLRALYDHQEINIDDACDRFTYFYNKNLVVDTHLYEGVEESIAGMHADGIFLAVLSNKPGDMCRDITAYFGLDRYLITTMGSGDVSTKKPEPEGIFEILRRAENKGFKKSKSKVWMAGDHYTDLQAAENAGLTSIFCEYGFGDRRDCKSDYNVDSFAEIRDILKG